VLALVVQLISALALWAAAGLGDGGDANPCVDTQTRVVYRNYGYDHWVILRSRCERHVTCVVTTDVQDEPMQAKLEPGETESLLTWRGSPARQFTAKSECRFD
jgi:hypothetical protein